MSVKDRFEFLSRWVLPGPDHPGFRITGDITQTQPASVAYESGVEHPELGGQIVSPVFDWLDAARELGRLPDVGEFDLAETVIEVFGSLKRAFALIRRVTSEEDWQSVRKIRSEDLLVYLALANFGKRPKLSDLSRKVQNDVRAFFGTYKAACDEADQLLFRAGNHVEIDAACRRSPVGRLCPNSLWIHESARDHLEPLLRIYEGCARAYIGSVAEANLIKLHRFSGKVSYLACPDFESEPHPITIETTKIWLRTLRVGIYETTTRADPPLLDRKDQMLNQDDNRMAKFERLTRQELKQGLIRDGEDFLPRSVWNANLGTLGFEHRGHRLVRQNSEKKPKEAALPKRCAKYGVGKRIGGSVYVHFHYEYVLGEPLSSAKLRLPSDFEYTVVKYNETNGNFSFIHCPDFDTADEPATGDYAVVKSDGSTKYFKALVDPYIYHHKWLFVAEDYTGFNIRASVERSVAWMSLPDIDKTRIGIASYWNSRVVPGLMLRPEEAWIPSKLAQSELSFSPCELTHFRKRG